MSGAIDLEQSFARLAWHTFWGERLEINLPDVTLIANLHLPPAQLLGQGDQALPVVIMLHGLGGNRHEICGNFIKAAATFALRKFAVLRFDFRGAGETGGTTHSISLARQIDDTEQVIEFVKHDLARFAGIPQFNLDRISLFGLSFGGLTAAAVAGKRSDIYSLALWEPPFDLIKVLTRLYGPLSLKKIRARGCFQTGMMELSPDFFECLEHIDIKGLIEGYAGSVLLVHGTDDQVVPVAAVESWREAFRSADLTVDLIEGADHAFTRDIWAWQAIGQTDLWLEDRR